MDTKQIGHEEFMKAMEEQGIVKPSHYEQYQFEPVTFIMENELPFWMGNVIKYVMRAGDKANVSETTDLKKAARYIQMRLNQLEGREITSYDV